MRHAASLLVVTALLCGASGCGKAPAKTPATPPPPRPAPASAHTDLFDEVNVVQIEIQIPRAGMNALRRTHWGDADERPVVKATVLESGVVYRDVAVHLKGAAGSFRGVDDRPALTLNFDKFAPGQSFHGLHKISLNNSVQDPSYLSEKFCRELFNDAGVPVPRAGHALVRLNGRDLGLYVVLEGANTQFLKRHFADPKGNLYDGGFVRDIDESLSVNCGAMPDDHSGLEALRVAVDHVAATGSLASLESALDLDRFLTMIAMEVLMMHWDGYALNKNNWRLFHDRRAQKMVFIPHGIDQTFGVGGPGRGRSDLLSPPVSGLVAGAVLRTGEGRKRYRAKVHELSTNMFRGDQLLARIDHIETALNPALAAYDSSTARAQEHQAEWFKQRVLRRAEEVRRQLNAPANPLKFGSDGALHMSGWRPSAIRSGRPDLAQTRDAQGRRMFGIVSGKEPCSASWRTRVLLGKGRYRFEGRVRLVEVKVDGSDDRSGAGLRISKGPPAGKLSGSSDWIPLRYDFQVEDDINDVELVCELKALQGEAWFDAGSLRLIRAE